MRRLVYTIGKQPCANLLRGDADVAALGDGNRRNVHQCPICSGRRTWCENCNTDHHEYGWETCTRDAYASREESYPSEYEGPEAKAEVA